ncbi:MAG: 4-hydroxy-tetrahydrodipicolinate synthase [Mycobacterium sp.]
MPRFGSVITAMVTPFDGHGALDLEGAATLAGHLATSGSDGLVVAGTTGEGPVLTDDERTELFRAVVSAVDVPVIASTGTNDTAHSVRLTEQAAACGVQGVLAVTPYYSRPSPAGLSAHFRAIAAASDLPVLLYDIPVRTGRRIGPELTLELARDVPTIVGVKDSTGDVPGAALVVAESPEGFDVYCGDDALALPFASIGGAGVVSVAAHWAGRLFAEMLGCHLSGDVDRAMAINQHLAESYRFESSDEFPNPVPAKAACRALGLPVGQCRLPHVAAPEALDDQARAVISRLSRLSPAHQSVG